MRTITTIVKIESETDAEHEQAQQQMAETQDGRLGGATVTVIQDNDVSRVVEFRVVQED